MTSSTGSSRDAGRVVGLRTASGGTYPETVHRVHVAVVAPGGKLVAQAGDAAWQTPLRSCAKPFQALGLFVSGAFERFAVTAEELALACASHEGSPRQLALVRAWLERLGVGVDDLQCGAHAPGDADSLRALTRADEAPTALHNNCSGKHTGMLATALALGAPTRDYLRLTHPVQRLVRQNLAALTGLAADDIPWAVDGCSAPTPVLSLTALARLGACLAIPDAAPDPLLAHGLRTARDAMIAHADLVGGMGVLDTLIMRRVAGVIAKRGADGVYLLALERSDLGPVGVALKVEDGSGDARTPAVMAVLDALGGLNPAGRTALAAYIRPRRVNHRGLTVGHYEADIRLSTPEVA